MTSPIRELQGPSQIEQGFLLAARTAPVMIWMTDQNALCVYVNEGWLRFTGRSFDSQLGNGWMEAVHRDDPLSMRSTYLDSCQRRVPFQMNYRARRYDGQYRWILDTGVPRFEETCLFAGYVGSCIDVTERKLAEEALSDLQRRVFLAQEEERERIARELHDDINQRISVLCWELQGMDRRPVGAERRSRKSIISLEERLRKLGSDIQAISHRLHSSHLEYLGLEAAAHALCRELHSTYKVEIAFTCEGIPRDLPKDVGVCLYRVLQEGLQNAIKHSGVREFKVDLIGFEPEARLTISDKGVGFDPTITDKQRGLGLISMRERLRLMNGDFRVDSELGGGTTIRCSVRIASQAHATSPR
jgi:PAS domain S-box-containing protein